MQNETVWSFEQSVIINYLCWGNTDYWTGFSLSNNRNSDSFELDWWEKNGFEIFLAINSNIGI